MQNKDDLKLKIEKFIKDFNWFSKATSRQKDEIANIIVGLLYDKMIAKTWKVIITAAVVEIVLVGMLYFAMLAGGNSVLVSEADVAAAEGDYQVANSVRVGGEATESRLISRPTNNYSTFEEPAPEPINPRPQAPSYEQLSARTQITQSSEPPYSDLTRRSFIKTGNTGGQLSTYM